MDLDCIGSIVLARRLFPGYLPLRSARLQPAAKKLYNLYEEYLAFANPVELNEKCVNHMVVVDTRSNNQVDEYVRNLKEKPVSIEVFDHHPRSEDDIETAVFHECSYGACATLLCLEIMEKKVPISKEDATIALTAIYADTGKFLHPNVSAQDHEAASFLLENGAELSLVKDFLVSFRETTQIILFHEIINAMKVYDIRGHRVHFCYMEIPNENGGIGAVVEKVFEVENCEIFFAFFFFPETDKLLIIARNACEEFSVAEVMADFGGGGHKNAASATISTHSGETVFSKFIVYLETILTPAATAKDIMSGEVAYLKPEMTLLEASLLLEATSHTGAPVLEDSGKLVGLITLKEIMKGRKLGKMQVPLSAFMKREPLCISPNMSIRSIEEIFYKNNIGHLPVVSENRLSGIVTRSDYLSWMSGETSRKKQAIKAMQEDLK